MNPSLLAQTESELATTDRLWREEMHRQFGPEGVLQFGYSLAASGGAGTRLRQAHDARRLAITAWRHERRVAV